MSLCEKTKYEKSYLGCDYFTATFITSPNPYRSYLCHSCQQYNDKLTAEVSVTISDDGVTEVDAGKYTSA